MNQIKEKEFLQTKIQQLMCNLATPEQLKQTRTQLARLKYRLQWSLEAKDRLVKDTEAAENNFVHHIYQQYDHELDKMILKKNVKGRKDLMMLGKWQVCVLDTECRLNCPSL